jgi:hypothetical protein
MTPQIEKAEQMADTARRVRDFALIALIAVLTFTAAHVLVAWLNAGCPTAAC